MVVRAATYCRVSTAQQEPGTSLESQRASCLRLAREIGADVVAEFQDVDSGAKENIPGLLALTDAANRHEFDLVLVDHPDRFSRNLTKKVLYRRDLLKAGVQLRYAAMRVEDTAEGRLMENISAVVAEYERERITFRTNRGRYAKAASGHVVGTGAPPYGYQYVHADDKIISLEPDPVTAPIAQRLLTDLLTQPATMVAAILNADHISPPRGARWHPASILKMARNPVYAGRAAYGQWEWQERKIVGPRPKEEWVYAEVPPLVDGDVWERLQETIAERKLQGRAMLEDDPYVLRGMLTCGHCGGLLAAHRNSGIRYYTCLRHYPSIAARQGSSRCELVSVRAEPIEQLIISSVRAFLLDLQTLEASLKNEAAERTAASTTAAPGNAVREITRQQQRLSQIHDLLLDAEHGSATWDDLRKKARDTQEQISRLETRRDRSVQIAPISLETIKTLEAFAAELRDQIDSGPDWQLILRELRTRVVITNAREGGWKIGKRACFDLDLQTSIPTIKLLHRKKVFSNIVSPQRIAIPISA